MTTRDATRDRYLSVFSILFTLVTSVISENIKRVIERIDRENRGVEEENIKNSYGFSSKSLVTLVTDFCQRFQGAGWNFLSQAARHNL